MLAEITVELADGTAAATRLFDVPGPEAAVAILASLVRESRATAAVLAVRLTRERRRFKAGPGGRVRESLTLFR